MDADGLTGIRAALRALVPNGVAWSAGAIADGHRPPPGIEPAAMERMSAQRRQEFFAGRAHAMLALEQLGVAEPVIPTGADRAPQWPPGFIGSISHAGKIAVAVAAPRSMLQGIGIDLEPAVPLDAELLDRVCRPEELFRLDTTRQPADEAKLIFSAKESVYKCVAPLMGIFLEFNDLEIVFDQASGQFRARGHGPAQSLIAADSLAGVFARTSGYWLTAVWQRPGLSSGQA